MACVIPCRASSRRAERLLDFNQHPGAPLVHDHEKIIAQRAARAHARHQLLDRAMLCGAGDRGIGEKRMQIRRFAHHAANAASSCFTWSACLFSSATSTSAAAYRSARAFNSRSFPSSPRNEWNILARIFEFIREVTRPRRAPPPWSRDFAQLLLRGAFRGGQFRPRSLLIFSISAAPEARRRSASAAQFRWASLAQFRDILVEARNLRLPPRSIRDRPRPWPPWLP